MSGETADASAELLRRVGAGDVDGVGALLDAMPELIHVAGPHPFWGGRPQPLHVAIERGRRDLFDLLLARGADVNGMNEEYDRWSPLMLAVKRPEMRAELVRRGAHVGLAEALMLADDARVDALLRSGPLPREVPNGGSFLAFARTPFAIDRLLAAGAPIDLKDRWGTTPIEAMSRLGETGAALVRHMMARGATANATAFARLGDLATLARLVEAEPRIAALAAVLLAAVDGGRHEVVAWLLQHGANPNARTDVRSRHTALHAAAWNGDLKMAELLVRAGADPRARDEEYDATPRGWAATSLEVTNNADCAQLVAYLGAFDV